MSRERILIYGMPRPTAGADPRGETGLAAGALALAAGVVHLALIGPHLGESITLAVLFGLAGAGEIGWGVLMLRRPGSVLAKLGALLMASVALAWLASRTTGLPFDAREPVGVLDCMTTAAEALCCWLALRLAGDERRAAPVAGVYAGLTLAVLLVLTLLTLGHHALR